MVPDRSSQLERDTAAFFANMSEEEAAEERELEDALCQTLFPVDVDRDEG